ncbi:MAG: isoquinoline 1-oxidoreductase subunit beta [Verrucomicrobiota bacterium]|jgi:isoquinoline 1-oxidoreductase beta subunit
MITSRRAFLKTAALGGASLVVAFNENRLFGAGKDAAKKEATGQFKPNGWIRVDADGTVTLTIGKSEMGQGVRTSLAMILADELEADWSRIKLVQALPGPDFKRLGTGGSFSLAGSWETLRQAAAAAREMLITAAAARWKVDRAACSAEKGEVLHAASKRRLKYAELVADAAKLPVPADPPLKKASDFRLIGKPTKRIDGRSIVTGAARYGIDTKVPGMLYASIERAPWTGAKPKSSQDAKALAIHGVRIVPCTSGIAAVGETTWAALKGRAALAVAWGDPPANAFDSEAHFKRLDEASEQKGFVTRKEEAPAGTRAVARTLYASYFYPFYAHAPVETMNCVADVRADRCVIWAPTQAPNSLQDEVAKFLGLAPEKVEVNVTLIGGGFGRRLAVDYALEAAEISRAVKAPVQVLWTRTDDTRQGHFQAASVHRLSAGLDSADALVAWRHTKAGSPHNLKLPDPAAVRDAGFYQDLSWGVYDVPYAIPSIETAYVTVDLAVRHGPWRSVFAPSSVFAREAFIDEVAHARGSDPLGFRLELLNGPDTVKAGSLTIDRRRLRRVLELAREKSGWGTAVAARHGRGVACNIYDGETHIAYVVDVVVDDAGKVRVERVVAVVDCGLVVNPTGVEQQIEGGILWGISSALLGEITFRGGTAQQANYADYGVARMRDTPAIEVHIVPSEATQPFGMGEPPVPPIAPAIVNAIFAATGKRIRRLPIRPGDLKAVGA